MNIRRVEWWDIPELLRFRNEVLGLDTTRLLTRGNPLNATGLLTHLQPLRRLCSLIVDGEKPLVGGIHSSSSNELAHLLYLAPISHLDTPALFPLLEALLRIAADWGNLYVLAEVEEASPLLDVLRHLRFSTYLWQSLWHLPPATNEAEISWEVAREHTFAEFLSLYHQIVPTLLHTIEEPGHHHRTVYRIGERAYFLLNKGMQGIMVTPLFHPDLEDPHRVLQGLVAVLRRRYNHPVYLRVPTYQSWLDDALGESDAELLNRQALLVHHLAKAEKAEAHASRAVLKAGHSAPLIPTPLSERPPSQ